MFEGLLEKFLTSFLGEYIENLDPAKLSVSIWSGSIQLNDLRLRSDLLTRLQLPFEVKLGIIKHLHLELPWSRLASQPVVCKLEQLHLVVTPQPEAEWVMRDTVTMEHKQARLAAMLLRSLEEARLSLNQQQDDGEKARKQAGYLDKYLARIKDNLRLEIANVSFRLEEATPSLKTCIGLAMK